MNFKCIICHSEGVKRPKNLFALNLPGSFTFPLATLRVVLDADNYLILFNYAQNDNSVVLYYFCIERMTKPLVSVIMPVYNTKQFVGEAIESILNQTFKEFEFIIVDDCSTDGSYEICQEYAKKDKRIKLYRNEKNGGVAYTKNRLIELTSTDYLASQDSDDVSFLDRLELEYKFLEEHKDYAVVAGNNEIIDEEGKIIGHRKYSDNIRSVILKKSPVSHPTTMMRKKDFLAVGGYSKVKYVEDYDLWIKLYSEGYKIKNIDKKLLKYRIRKGAQKGHVKETIKGTLNCQKKAYEKIKPSFSDRVYHICLGCLTLLPNKWIMALFKLLTY